MYRVIDATMDSDSDVGVNVAAPMSTQVLEPTAIASSTPSATAPQGARADGVVVEIADGSDDDVGTVAASNGAASGPSAMHPDVVVIDDLVKEVYVAVKAVMINMMQTKLKKSGKFLVDLL